METLTIFATAALAQYPYYKKEKLLWNTVMLFSFKLDEKIAQQTDR